MKNLLLLCATWLSAQQIDVYSRPRQAERSRTYDVLHYRIQLSFDEPSRSFHGQTRITLQPLGDGFDTCVLDVETFKVLSVRGDANLPLRFEQTPGKLVVHLERRYQPHEKLSLTVSYRGENVAVDPERFGMPKGYGLGLAFKPETQDHPRLINTLSFPEGARHWFPCYDHPNDKATSEVIATVKTGNQVISNGRLVSVTEDSRRGEKTFHWSQEQPHATYLFVLIAGPYVKLDDSLEALPIGYWVYPQDVDNARRSFHQTPAAIAYFNGEFGYTYPWPKYDQIAIPDFGGGAESTNATVIGDNTIHDEKADKDFPSHWLIAHEAAHQWWGNLLTMRDWSHTWLNESFATYSEYLYSQHTLGEDEGALNLLAKKQQYLAEAREKYQRPIVFDRWNVPNDNFDRHTYQKGAVVLSMLRSVMGDAPFRRAIGYYLKKHAFQSVDTHDLLVAIRESTGQVLDWFFEQWIYQAGHPVLDVSYTWSDSKIRLKVVQKQDVPGRIPVFQLPVAIGVTTEKGKTSHALWIREREQILEIDCPESPLLVRFDEGNRLLKEWTFSKTREELLYQLQHDDVIGRMEAAAALRSHVDDATVAGALRRAASDDGFWSVRRDAILALATADSAFLRARSLDPVPAVRVAALRVLGDRKDGALNPFFAERFRAEDSYLAQAEALRAMGKSGATGQTALLREASTTKSPGNVIARAAQWALESARQ
jgi:aminopeptidase N